MRLYLELEIRKGGRTNDVLNRTFDSRPQGARIIGKANILDGEKEFLTLILVGDFTKDLSRFMYDVSCIEGVSHIWEAERH